MKNSNLPTNKQNEVLEIPDRHSNITARERLTESAYHFAIWLMVLLWFYTSLDKIIGYEAYKLTMQGQFFSANVLAILNPALPSVELITGFLLIMPRTVYLGLTLSAVLMITFTTYVSLVYFGGFSARPCSCAGLFRYLSWGSHVLVNLFFMLVVLTGIIIHSIRRKEAWKN